MRTMDMSLLRAIGNSSLILAALALPASVVQAKGGHGGGHGGGHHGGGHHGGGGHHRAAAITVGVAITFQAVITRA